MINDPIFAAIAEHKAAWDRFGAMVDHDLVAGEYDAADFAETETAFRLARTLPKTLAGANAYLDYILTALSLRDDVAIHATAFRTLEMGWGWGAPSLDPRKLAEASPFDLPPDFYVDA